MVRGAPPLIRIWQPLRVSDIERPEPAFRVHCEQGEPSTLLIIVGYNFEPWFRVGEPFVERIVATSAGGEDGVRASIVL